MAVCSRHFVPAPIEDIGVRGDLILMQDDHGVNRLSPLIVRNADRGHVLDPGMSAKNLLHFGRIDVQSAADDHVALPVGEMETAVRVATGHVADRAILAPERSSCLLRRFPVTLKRE